jgi:hypothetical protein
LTLLQFIFYFIQERNRFFQKAQLYKSQRDDARQLYSELHSDVYDKDGKLKLEAELTSNQKKNLQKVKDFIEYKCTNIVSQKRILKNQIFNLLAVNVIDSSDEE